MEYWVPVQERCLGRVLGGACSEWMAFAMWVARPVVMLRASVWVAHLVGVKVGAVTGDWSALEALGRSPLGMCWS